MTLYRHTPEGRVKMSAKEEAATRAGWAESSRLAAEDQRKSAAMEELKALDSQSIRAIREWVAGQDNPVADLVKDIEARAEIERAKLRESNN